MKKIIILIIFILITGCTSKEQKALEREYFDMIEQASNCSKSEEMPFNIELIFNELVDNYYVYRLYIDEPKEEITDIEAIVIHNQKTKDIFPTTGIYESKLSLKPNYINDNYVKGIILIGYLNSDKATFKAFIKYNNQTACYVKTFN